MKKTILFRIHSMEMGGVQKMMLNIITSLDCSKYEPLVLLDIFEGELLLKIPKDLEVLSLTKGKNEFSKVKVYRYLQLLNRNITLEMYRYFPSLLKNKLNNRIPNIEIAMSNSSLGSLIRSPFKKSKKINWFTSPIRLYSPKAANHILSMMHRCELTVFISHTMKSDFERHVGKSIFNDVFIPLVVNVKEIKTKSLEQLEIEEKMLFKGSVKTFVSIGRLISDKGYNLLLETHIYLIKRGFNHRIMVIGDGPEYPILKKKIHAEGVQNSFFLIGFRDNPYPYIAQADYYIQPCHQEGCPLSVMEAIILGKPLISTDNPGITDIVERNESGYLSGFSKPELAQAIKKFLLDPNFTSQMASYQKAKDFTQHYEFAQKQLEFILQ